jgi:hypothetical protein
MQQKTVMLIIHFSSSTKPLSLETANTSVGISKDLKNLLKIVTSGDIAS